MTFKPLITFRAITIRNAFILNALVIAAIAAVSIELRRYLNEEKRYAYLNELEKMLITFLGTFLMGLITYCFIRFLFGYGDGMLATENFKTFF